MPRSWIFLRRVLRFRPSISAARTWLPRVAARVRRINGSSTCVLNFGESDSCLGWPVGGDAKLNNGDYQVDVPSHGVVLLRVSANHS